MENAVIVAGSFASLIVAAICFRRRYTEIIRASRRGHALRVKSLLEHKPRLVFRKDVFNRTSLHEAAKRGHEGAVKLLLDGKASVDAISNWGNTPLHNAAEKGHTGTAALLVSHGADVNAAGNLGRIPLHEAAIHGHVDMVKLFLANNVAINAKDHLGSTPSYLAAYNKRDEVLKLLSAEIRRRKATALRPAHIDLNRSDLSLEDMHNEFCTCVMKPEHFRVRLACPNCSNAISGFSCSHCGAPRERAGEKAGAVATSVLHLVLQGIAFFLRPFTYVLSKDLAVEYTRKEASRCNELLLARRYQAHTQGYDQAALCYLTWLKRVDVFDCPSGFVEFLKSYKGNEGTNPALRDSLLDVAFIKACRTWSDNAKHVDLIKVTYVGSDTQMREAEFIEALEEHWRLQGKNTSGLRELVSLLSRLGCVV